MIEVLILHELSQSTLTMYGISKAISSDLSVLTMPSIGTIKPALIRLEKSGFIKTQKLMSKGGRPSTFYSVTDLGKDALRTLLLSPMPDNPIQFMPAARTRLFCADMLSEDELLKLVSMLKTKTEVLMVKSEKLTAERETEFLKHIVLDNLSCEYKNFISLLAGIERSYRN